MAELNIIQEEADFLIAMEKHRVDDTNWIFPKMGDNQCIPLISYDGREEFILDIHRSGIIINKVKYQNRARNVIVLVRLDLEGSPHLNPDGQELTTPHIHLYKEGYGDKWAYPVPDNFSNLTDLFQTLDDFMKYCNITKVPLISRGIFS